MKWNTTHLLRIALASIFIAHSTLRQLRAYHHVWILRYRCILSCSLTHRSSIMKWIEENKISHQNNSTKIKLRKTFLFSQSTEDEKNIHRKTLQFHSTPWIATTYQFTSAVYVHNNKSNATHIQTNKQTNKRINKRCKRRTNEITFVEKEWRESKTKSRNRTEFINKVAVNM